MRLKGVLADQRELLSAIRILGIRRLLDLRRAHRLTWEKINGFYATRVIQTMFNVGFFDALATAEPVDVVTFANEKDLDAVILRSMCDTLFALEILRRDGDRYSLTEQGRLLVDVGRGWFDGVYGYEDLAHSLEDLLTKRLSYGTDVRRRGDFVAKGSGQVESLVYFPLAIEEIRRQGCRRVLDLGCGDGTFLRHLCGRLSGVSGCGIDLSPEAIGSGQQQIRDLGMTQRIDLMAHDIEALESFPLQMREIDFATAFFILHELAGQGRDRVLRFLRTFRGLFPRVPLMAFEPDRPTPEQMRARKGMSISYFLQHDLSRQLPLARHEWMALLGEAGFECIEMRNLRFVRTVILMVR